MDPSPPIQTDLLLLQVPLPCLYLQVDLLSLLPLLFFDCLTCYVMQFKQGTVREGLNRGYL